MSSASVSNAEPVALRPETLLRLGVLEVVQVDPLDLHALRHPHTHIEADHQPRQRLAVDQHQPGRAGLLPRRQRRFVNVEVVISTPFCAPRPISAPMNACTASLPMALPGW